MSQESRHQAENTLGIEKVVIDDDEEENDISEPCQSSMPTLKFPYSDHDYGNPSGVPLNSARSYYGDNDEAFPLIEGLEAYLGGEGRDEPPRSFVRGDNRIQQARELSFHRQLGSDFQPNAVPQRINALTNDSISARYARSPNISPYRSIDASSFARKPSLNRDTVTIRRVPPRPASKAGETPVLRYVTTSRPLPRQLMISNNTPGSLNGPRNDQMIHKANIRRYQDDEDHQAGIAEQKIAGPFSPKKPVTSRSQLEFATDPRMVTKPSFGYVASQQRAVVSQRVRRAVPPLLVKQKTEVQAGDAQGDPGIINVVEEEELQNAKFFQQQPIRPPVPNTAPYVKRSNPPGDRTILPAGQATPAVAESDSPSGAEFNARRPGSDGSVYHTPNILQRTRHPATISTSPRIHTLSSPHNMDESSFSRQERTPTTIGPSKSGRGRGRPPNSDRVHVGSSPQTSTDNRRLAELAELAQNYGQRSPQRNVNNVDNSKNHRVEQRPLANSQQGMMSSSRPEISESEVAAIMTQKLAHAQDAYSPTLSAKPARPKRQSKSNHRKSTADNDSGVEGDDYITRCFCGMKHNDPFMIACDKCDVWQHVNCMGGSEHVNTSGKYLCEKCNPRELPLTKEEAIKLQERYLQKIALGVDKVKKLPRSSGKTPKTPYSPKRIIKSTKRILSKKYETVSENNYSRRLRGIVAEYQTSMGDCDSYLKLKTLSAESPDRCKSMIVAPEVNGLVANDVIRKNDPVVEFNGNFSCIEENSDEKLSSTFYHSVIYSLDNEVIFADASKQGSIARDARRSCRPNTVLKHCIIDGKLRLFLLASEDIDHSTEITLPFDHVLRPGLHMLLECACRTDQSFTTDNQDCLIMEYNRKIAESVVMPIEHQPSLRKRTISSHSTGSHSTSRTRALSNPSPLLEKISRRSMKQITALSPPHPSKQVLVEPVNDVVEPILKAEEKPFVEATEVKEHIIDQELRQEESPRRSSRKRISTSQQISEEHVEEKELSHSSKKVVQPDAITDPKPRKRSIKLESFVKNEDKPGEMSRREERKLQQQLQLIDKVNKAEGQQVAKSPAVRSRSSLQSSDLTPSEEKVNSPSNARRASKRSVAAQDYVKLSNSSVKESSGTRQSSSSLKKRKLDNDMVEAANFLVGLACISTDVDKAQAIWSWSAFHDGCSKLGGFKDIDFTGLEKLASLSGRHSKRKMSSACLLNTTPSLKNLPNKHSDGELKAADITILDPKSNSESMCDPEPKSALAPQPKAHKQRARSPPALIEPSPQSAPIPRVTVSYEEALRRQKMTVSEPSHKEEPIKDKEDSPSFSTTNKSCNYELPVLSFSTTQTPKEKVELLDKFKTLKEEMYGSGSGNGREQTSEVNTPDLSKEFIGPPASLRQMSLKDRICRQLFNKSPSKMTKADMTISLMSCDSSSTHTRLRHSRFSDEHVTSNLAPPTALDTCPPPSTDAMFSQRGASSR